MPPVGGDKRHKRQLQADYLTCLHPAQRQPYNCVAGSCGSAQDSAKGTMMKRLVAMWHDLTEGHSLSTLWLDFRREARSSFESTALRTSPSGSDLRGWRRLWTFAREMFFHLSPSRRVLLLIAVILLFSFRVGSGEDAGGDPRGGLMLSALCLLAILALEVADRVALKRDLEVARDIQNWLVPKIAPQIPGLDIAFATRPANTVAGDYYDVLLMPAADGAASAVLFVVADVAGKGIPAGLLMASFRACLHTLTATADLSSLVARLNRFCAADSLGGRYFTTAFLAQHYPGTGSLSYVNAGHNPPLLRRASGAILELEAGGLPLGAFADSTYQLGQVAIEPGDLLLIYTDGVIEAVNEAGGEFGLERLRAFVRDTFARSADFQQKLFASVDAFTGQSRQFDDITCMVIQVAA